MRPGPGGRGAVFLLFFLSGFTGLVYEVLWLEDLSLLFGNAAHAAATTLSVFFLGIAVGGWLWGERAARVRSPLAVYGLLEIGIGATGLLYFGLVDLYRWLYEPLYAAVGDSFVLLLGAKILLALGVLFPPALLMGGTFPMLGQLLVRRPEELGRTGALLYGTNTVGAALGAFSAGFLLPPALGFRNAYLVAVALSVMVGGAALWLSRGWETRGAVGAEGDGRRMRDRTAGAKVAASDAGEGPGGSAEREGSSREAWLPWSVAFVSGFFTLALEVVWTRMFAQVLQNSVYTFSTILVIFLLSLGAGSLLASRLSALRWPPRTVLVGLLTGAALATGAVPLLFHAATGGMGYVAAGEAWGPYIAAVFGTAGVVLFLPGLILGTVFPYLLRIQERRVDGDPGRIMGRLVAVNTAGGIVGSLVAGFVLLTWLGLWGTGLLVSAGYAALGVVVAWESSASVSPARRARALAVPGLAGILLLTAMNPTGLPLVRTAGASEEVVDLREGSHGVVAVVRSEAGLRIKVNNFYSLGGTGAADNERNQALLPLMVHPHPDSVFFLGMGTGITAGAALAQPVERVVVTELVPDVVEAAREHFGPWTGGLFRDARVRVLTRDGRNHLAATDERYDVVVADLFIPWKAGSGSLYTVEHFGAVRERLRPGGVFVQWIPLYQVTRRDFDLIARTFLEVFPEVRVWRGDFFAGKPILALVGSVDAPPLDPAVVVRHGRYAGGGRDLPGYVYLALTLPFYAGNLGEAPHLIDSGPINTDDRPILEYAAPVSHRRARASGNRQWFTGLEYLDFLEGLQAAVPPAADPYLARLEPGVRDYVRAGLAYHRASILRDAGRTREAEASFRAFLDVIPIDFRPGTADEDAYSSFGEGG